jgi:hypothetical protein
LRQKVKHLFKDQSRHQIGIDGQRVVGICRANEAWLAQTKQIILAHKAQHPLVIGLYTPE